MTETAPPSPPSDDLGNLTFTATFEPNNAIYEALRKEALRQEALRQLAEPKGVEESLRDSKRPDQC